MSAHTNFAIPLRTRLANVKAGKEWKHRSHPGLNPRIEGREHVRWVETPEAYGMRWVGYADEVASLRHQGWFTDDEYQDEVFRGVVFRGVVYRMATRKGTPRFVYGYADPNNKGAALLCFDYCDDKIDAARWADSFAERKAEEERAYRAKEREEMEREEAEEARLDNLAECHPPIYVEA